MLPDWTFQPSALQELWSAGPDGLEDDADLDWSVLSPQLSSSLVPLVDGEAVGEELWCQPGAALQPQQPQQHVCVLKPWLLFLNLTDTNTGLIQGNTGHGITKLGSSGM